MGRNALRGGVANAEIDDPPGGEVNGKVEGGSGGVSDSAAGGIVLITGGVAWTSSRGG
jgi:hypothetical protein